MSPSRPSEPFFLGRLIGCLLIGLPLVSQGTVEAQERVGILTGGEAALPVGQFLIPSGNRMW